MSAWLQMHRGLLSRITQTTTKTNTLPSTILQLHFITTATSNYCQQRSNQTIWMICGSAWLYYSW
jgi:hypothetical protein